MQPTVLMRVNNLSYLNFNKAFDKVPHKRLVLQLKAHGIKGEVLNWIEQWLFGREQRVMLNGCKSEWKQSGNRVGCHRYQPWAVLEFWPFLGPKVAQMILF